MSSAFEQESEESLGQILSVMGGVASSAHEGVKWRPVIPEELREGRLNGIARAIFFRGCDDHAPMGSQEFPITRFPSRTLFSHKLENVEVGRSRAGGLEAIAGRGNA
jgi:hypothetical protein